jgi:hypothetical protein
MSSFRFLTSARRSQYSVWRGDEHLGHVTKIVHRVFDRGVTRTAVSGWVPSTPARTDLAAVPTREEAARVLWATHQMR